MPLPTKKIKYKRGFKKWADDEAGRLRKELGLSAFSPLCAFKLCEHLDIPVWQPNQVGGLTPEQLKILLQSSSNHWSAATIPLSTDQHLIIHNPNHSPARQQSNLMHEVAHILCGHEVSEERKSTGLSGFLRNHDEEQENEAEWLGACLQLPRPALLWALKRRMKLDQIAEHFSASVEMVRYRINVTGVKKQLSYMRK